MKTNLGIETTNEERAILARAWGSKNKLVSRQEIKDFVNEQIQLAIHCEKAELAASRPSEEVDKRLLGEDTSDRDRSIRDFVPSRGDEPYLYRPEDPELATVCSSLLDAVEFIQGYAWDALERNRK